MSSYISALYLLIFLPGTALMWYLIPKRYRPWLLLSASYFFFWSISRKLLVYLLVSTVAVHYIGLWLSVVQGERDKVLEETERAGRKKVKSIYIRRQRWIVFFAACIHIGTLLVVKYSGFLCSNLNILSETMGFSFTLPVPKLAMPIGISFYTMQAMSYIFDVYREKIKADNSLGRLALYMAFFPTIMEGPICRYTDTAVRLWESERPDFRSVTFGIQRILYGIFKKILIADRLNILIKTVFTDYTQYDGGIIAFAAVAYTCQLYMEFSGTMDVVIGSAELFGLHLPENFKRPFFSKSISEFWTRWHITLGTWFRDYVFYPLSMSKPLKRLTSRARKRLGSHFGPLIAGSMSLFVVWFFNGLWHGVGWHYIFFGMYHLVLIVSASFIEPFSRNFLERIHIRRDEGVYRIFRMLRTALLVCVGELFFRATGLRAGFAMFLTMIMDFRINSFVDGSLLKLGMDGFDFAVVAGALLVVFSISVLNERGIAVRAALAEKRTVIRWAVYYALILCCIIFGAYGMNYTPVDPIYAGF